MGIFERLFGKSTGLMTDGEAMKIINAHGKAMMDKKSAFGELSALPYPKARIKEAIIHGIKEADDPKFPEQLRTAYIALSEWQVGFGSRRGPGQLTAEELGDPAKAMARIAAAGEDFLRLPKEVAAEVVLLQAELKLHGGID
jgi:hypothetical protein